VDRAKNLAVRLDTAIAEAVAADVIAGAVAVVTQAGKPLHLTAR
jgi:hypothetical protein